MADQCILNEYEDNISIDDSKSNQRDELRKENNVM